MYSPTTVLRVTVYLTIVTCVTQCVDCVYGWYTIYIVMDELRQVSGVRWFGS